MNFHFTITPYLKYLNLKKIIRYMIIFFMIFLAALLIFAFQSRSLPDLEVWHEPISGEFTRSDATDSFTFDDYLILEKKLFDTLESKIITEATAEEIWTPNRYVKDSPSDPKKHFVRNWNRTQILEPSGEPSSAVLLIHGLTDSPYSMRALAEIFQQNGALAICLRIPGHGTTPGALNTTTWKDWLAIIEIAAEYSHSKAPNKPFFLVGYSNGGALALKYAADTISENDTPKPDKIYLLNPAVGVTKLASLSNLHKSLSWIPYFKKFRWLDVIPEYDPFKYNSFPKNAGHQSHTLSQEIATSLNKIERSQLPPIVTFQSVVDATVSLPALIENIYIPGDHPDNKLILFDINRFSPLTPFIKDGNEKAFQNFISRDDLPFQLDLITNTNPQTLDIIIKSKQAHSSQWNSQPSRLSWPDGIYSLSHVALPFKQDDPFYGNQPQSLNQGNPIIQLGVTVPRGEKGSLAIPIENLLRLRSNPFFEIIKREIEN